MKLDTIKPVSRPAALTRDPLLLIAAMIGVLPMVAGLLYRTYAIMVQPDWLETTRQMGLLFVAAELGVVLLARRRGLDYAAYWTALDRPVRIALGIFLGTFWISSVFVSPHPGVSTFLSLTWIIHLGFAVSVHFLVARATARELKLFTSFVVGGFVLFLPLVAVHFAFPPPAHTVPRGWLDWGSAVPGFISLRLFGAYAGALATLVLGILWMADPRGRQAGWFYGLLTICLAATIWSGTRAAVLGIGAAGIAGLILTRRLPPVRFMLLVPLCTTLAALLALPLMPEGDSRFLLYASGDTASSDTMTGGRLFYWDLVWKAYLKVPIFGGGSASTLWLAPLEGGGHVQPHNVLLQFLLSWGLIAAIASLFVLGAATWRAHQAARRRSWLLPLVLTVDCLLAMSLVDGMLYFPRFIILMLVCLALCFAGNRVQPAGADA